MPARLPNRFDIIYAHGIDKTIKEDCIGYVFDVREDARKSKNVSNNMGLPSFTPQVFSVKFLNHELKTYSSEEVLKNISEHKWKVAVPNQKPPSDKALYEVGDLVYNKKNKKVSLVIEQLNTKQGHEDNISDKKNPQYDLQTKEHSQFWYKVQSPGQQWEAMSETLIEHGIENNFIEVHKKKKINE